MMTLRLKHSLNVNYVKAITIINELHLRDLGPETDKALADLKSKIEISPEVEAAIRQILKEKKITWQ
ncbi:MAG: hypothetical protein ACYCT2_08490 [Thermoplasmataceae archaeon]